MSTKYVIMATSNCTPHEYDDVDDCGVKNNFIRRTYIENFYFFSST